MVGVLILKLYVGVLNACVCSLSIQCMFIMFLLIVMPKVNDFSSCVCSLSIQCMFIVYKIEFCDCYAENYDFRCKSYIQSIEN